MMRFFLTGVLVIAVSTLFAPSVSAQQYFQAVIDGAQGVPPSGSPATGLGCFVLNTDGTLDYLVSYNGLTGVETAAHIHGPAPAGLNAGVVFPFAVGSPMIGIFGPLTAAQVTDLSNGLYYVNIHSTLFPGGEIRGQILPSGESCATPTEETTWGTIKTLYE